MQFEEKSFDGLEGFTDGEVLLSPYAYIEEVTVRKVSLNELITLENEEVFWGLYDGTGDSILLTLSDYLDKYVSSFDINDENVKTTSYEGKPEPHGSELHNMHKLYPDAVYVEFYLPPSEKGGLDWRGLIYVVSKVDGSFLLNAIIHNQWTV